MIFSLFYYICFDPFITRGLESIYHEMLESIYHEGVGIHLSRRGWNPFITRGLESIYHEEVGIHLSRGSWNLIDRFKPATHPKPRRRRTCNDLEIVGDRCSFSWYGCNRWPSMFKCNFVFIKWAIFVCRYLIDLYLVCQPRWEIVKLE